MADQTQGAVDSLVGLLSTAIKDEAKLLGGVQGDMQFIKDEMESMNGFLLHLTKTDGMHDDQLRAWMKQVREIAYIAQDCIELYRRDFAGPPDKGLWALLRHLPTLLRSIPARHRLANRIRELKIRVHDVGERRMRYDVQVPRAKEPQQMPADGPDDEVREYFLRALARDKKKQQQEEAPSFDEAIDLLPKDLQSAATTVRAGLEKWLRLVPDATPRHGSRIRSETTEIHRNSVISVGTRDVQIGEFRSFIQIFGQILVKFWSNFGPKSLKFGHFGGVRNLLPTETQNLAQRTRTICMEMLLRALRAHSQVRRTAKTKQELEKLVAEDSANLPHDVMVFCYSKLSKSYKSCLQYLYAFHDETAVSRTSLVRRWVAEGLVEKQGDHSLEEAGELCFKELLFRGFLLPADRGTAGKVKSCTVDEIVWDFVYQMSTSENFLSDLPTHLKNQLRIRGFVKRQEEQLQMNPRPREVDGPWSICGFLRPTRPRDDITAADPMDDMVRFLKSLSEGEPYRLNVLDLGGCRGLKKSHLKSIYDVLSIKYLSLRNTGVSRLPKQINKLRLLETLDIRQTEVRRDTEHIYLPKLKHLLASPTITEEEEPLCAWMPHKIGTMRDMEILSRVQVQHGRAAAQRELEEVGRLRQLRKLGVVLGGREEAQENMKHLLRAVSKLSDCLRSLSVWITPPSTNVDLPLQMQMNPEHNKPKLLESLDISGLGNTDLPSWILELKRLSEITLCDTLLSKESLQDLGKNLLCLRCLRLRRNSYSDSKLTFSKDGFQALRFLIVEGDTITRL